MICLKNTKQFLRYDTTKRHVPLLKRAVRKEAEMQEVSGLPALGDVQLC